VTGNGTTSFTAPVAIDITGGQTVAHSNIAITFGAGPATDHFGSEPLRGVVGMPR
jgi:hypothetical protein